MRSGCGLNYLCFKIARGWFPPGVFERYQRSEKAFVSALAEMFIQGVSTPNLMAIIEELCMYSFSAPAVSGLVGSLDEQLSQFACRMLEEGFPYLILDGRYEKVLELGSIRGRAVLIGIGWDGWLQVLSGDLANWVSDSSWREKGLR